MQSAIAYSINNLLEENPGILRLLKILDWSVHHPIISLIVLLFAIAIFVSFIKGIIRLIETASWSIIQIPLKLFIGILQLSWLSINKVTSLVFYKIKQPETSDSLLTLKPDNATIDVVNHTRLTEIYQRLTELNQEQEKLLQEVNLILGRENNKK